MTALRQWPASHVRMGYWRRPGGHCALRVLSGSRWEIISSGQVLRAELLQIWPAWGWATLQFVVNDQSMAGRRMRLTVWRHRTSAVAWRELRVVMARQAAMPERVMGMERT